MLAMPSGLSGSTFWIDTMANVASHMKMFETNSDTEYCFQSCCSFGLTPVTRSTSRSIGKRTGSSSVRCPVNTLNMYRPSNRLVAIVNRMVKPTATYSVPIEASEPFRAQHGVHEIHEGGNAQQQRQQSHGSTYTRSHRVTNHSMAANVISEPTRLGMISYAVFCLKKNNISASF